MTRSYNTVTIDVADNSAARRDMLQHVEVLVEERVDWQTSLFLVQRHNRDLAVVQYMADVDPSAPTAEEILKTRTRWFGKDMIAGALVSTNIRPLVDPDKMLSFLGCCAVALGLVEHEEVSELHAKLHATDAMYQESRRFLELMTPKRKHAAQARAFLNRTGIRREQRAQG